jgi:hypothetical protein
MPNQPVTSDHDLIIEIHTTVKAMQKTIDGNGQPGLIQRVGSLELWRSMLAGATALIVLAATIWAAVK